jgi:hypothetical protein
MAYGSSGEAPHHDIRYGISDEDAAELLNKLADPGSKLREDLARDPRGTLLRYGIDIVGIPESVELPEAGEIKEFISNHLHRSGSKTDNVGYAILYFMLGAMPIVVADRDAAP